MSPAADNGSPGPFIAGSEDPMATAEFQDSPDDPFGSSSLFDFSSNSPDTLQRLDVKRKTDGQALLSGPELGVSTSPNGSYHEYSDDSAESSKPSSNRQGQMPSRDSPGDANMESAFDTTMSYDDIFDQDAPFMPDSEANTTQHDGLFGDSTYMDRQSMSFDQPFMGRPPSSAAAFQSPGMPTISPSEGLTPSHNRQNSHCGGLINKRMAVRI